MWLLSYSMSSPWTLVGVGCQRELATCHSERSEESDAAHTKLCEESLVTRTECGAGARPRPHT